MSKLLLNEEPLLIMPQLAVKIGLNESIVLQQIHYWNQINKKSNNNFKDGYYWTFNSYEKWQDQFPFWSIPTIQRTISKLEKMNLVIVGNYNKMKIDRTKWYRIDYDVLENIENTPSYQIDITNTSKRYDEHINLTRPIPETNSETNSETNLIGGKWVGIANANTNKPLNYFDYLIKLVKTTDSEYKNEIIESVIYYYGKYQETFGENHIRYTEEYSYKIIEKLNEIFDVGVLDDVMTGRCDMDLETFKIITDKHFTTEYKQMSPTLLSFLNDRVLIRRFYEECY